MLIESLVISHINYCCSLYYAIPATSTKSLDRFTRSSIRVLHRVQLYDHESVNYHLVNYTWLTIYQCSTFSYLKLIVKVLNNRIPSYLNDLLQSKFTREIYETRLICYYKRVIIRYQDMENVLSV